MTTDALFGALVNALADPIADRVVARLHGVAADRYDSRHLPPRCSRRRFAEICRSGRVTGAFKDGRDWVCPRSSWDSARKNPRTIPIQTEIRERADALLSRSGLRVVGGRE